MLWFPLLLVAWIATAIGCVRLCAAAVVAAGPGGGGRAVTGRRLAPEEAAFLVGGPYRVLDVTLFGMHLRHRLLLAHTGWATVVEPEPAGELERAVVSAAGPGGQERTARIRERAAGSAPVRALGERLSGDGLAVPPAARALMVSALRGVRTAAALTVGCALAALVLPAGGPGPLLTLLWFALPLVASLSCLAIARVEVRPYTRWASPAGRWLLTRTGTDPGGDERAALTAVALRGPDAVTDPLLRRALGHPR
ncbi:TIGR04222 domain-containing membrane protein [Streptomyces sp. NPDC000594]|uniref:TIGR04222 domain-containing membrane protein n=1 Tax=Streptomyces sp. NPDC000594 TaxID=3154261 RepID=UPI003326FCBF